MMAWGKLDMKKTIQDVPQDLSTVLRLTWTSP
jgi:hypothetical protein